MKIRAMFRGGSLHGDSKDVSEIPLTLMVATRMCIEHYRVEHVYRLGLYGPIVGVVYEVAR